MTVMADYGEFTVWAYDYTALLPARERAGKSQSAVAAEIGKHEDVYRRYEHGLVEPQAGTLAAIAEALGVNVSEFFIVDEQASGRARNMFGNPYKKDGRRSRK